MSKPIVAIVGRPNVGKSLLFNRITGKRQSIVDDEPGITRDRLYAEASWRGRGFIVVDTGGIEPHTDDELLRFMREQALSAINEADVIILVTDVRTGVTAADADVASMLQKSRKPVILCVNKCDSIGYPPADFYEFYSLGFGDPIAASAVHGHGVADILDECFKYFITEEEEKPSDGIIRIAVIGKPNTGKSSLINTILGENRVIVSEIAGTTRDAVDTYIKNEYGEFCLIDTAGLRRHAKVDDNIEKYSVMRTLQAIERSDVCLIMIDARDGVKEQDTKVAGYAHEKGKASVIVVNKWDTVEKNTQTMLEYEKKIRAGLAYMPYAPVVFISAKTGERVEKIWPLIVSANEQSTVRITTGALNDLLRDAVMRVQPPTDRGKRLKVYYITQTGVKPPHFVCFCNNSELFHFSYRRYIENRIRDTYGFKGTPIRITVRQRGDDGNLRDIHRG